MYQKSILIVLLMVTTIFGLSCINRQNQPVSWFTALRYPGNLTTTNVRYAYIDPTSGSSFEIIKGVNIDDKSEPLFKTIENINTISGANQNLLVFTNCPPNGTTFDDGAHAKGIIAFDKATDTGVYILHTFLSYPGITSDGTLNATVPLSGNENAEDNGPDGNYVYCVSFTGELLNYILNMIPSEIPDLVYASGVFTTGKVDPNFNYDLKSFTLPDGETQWFVTKGPKAGVIMYDDILANRFFVNLAVNTPGGQPPACPPKSPFTIVNVDSVNLNSEDSWPIADDNSKYAISILEREGWVFLCDNDRDPEQDVRGGSCFVSSNPSLYAAFKQILTYKSCPM